MRADANVAAGQIRLRLCLQHGKGGVPSIPRPRSGSPDHDRRPMIIIGSGIGGATLAAALAPTGRAS
jgi:hypothetical protein